MSCTKSYSIAHVDFSVTCKDETFGKKVMGAFERHFFLKNNASAADCHHLNLDFYANLPPCDLPGDVRTLFDSPHLRVLRNGTSCYLVGEASLFHLELDKGLGTGYLDSTFWDGPPKYQQESLMLSLLWLFHRHGLFAVHGNALVKKRVAVLIAGDSGCGKSTTALGLIHQGWHYLSDDITLLSQNSKDIEATAFQKGFSIDSRLSDYYQGLKLPMESSSLNGAKKFIDITPAYPDQSINSCSPNVLIFPKIVSEEKSRLLSINKTSALIQLMKYSGGIMIEKDVAVHQAGVLKALVDQTSWYELHAGSDLYDDPSIISSILGLE